MTAAAVTDPTLVAFAAEVGDDGPIAVEGGRTRWSSGGDVDPTARLVRAPEGIVVYRPEEMTVQVRTGTSVEELHAALADRGQRSALPTRGGTVGGAVVVGEDGLCRLGHGRVREAVLQVRYVSAEGRLVTGGGPVVKNVSGFNVPKVIVGSLGTLGLVAEVVLRTNPIAEVECWFTTPADPVACFDALLAPGAVLWDGTSTWIRLEGHRADVDHEVATLRRLATVDPVDGPPPLPPHRWSLPPSQLPALGSASTGSFVASIGVGTVWCDNPQPHPPFDPVVAEISGRMKALFDPIGRLNPGRHPER